MLNYLHEQISSIINIEILSESEDGISIQYYDDNLPSPDQVNQINSIVNSWPLQKLKLEKIQLLDQLWKSKLKTGWQTPAGYYLGIDISDVSLLNGAFTLAKEAHNIGINDPVSIVDMNGQSHPMSLQDLTLLMLQYGQARASLSNSYASIKQDINYASSSEELESINIIL
jgi:hypothetical protein